ncbi:septation protein IspZ [Brevundimonas sp. A19_0]|uniref:inner membrane-spanning protein YciB n=1 Tax=Brevundimonas sp. A19_0 TaxID=2821087 RepID=UPI001ADB3413|nr:septation protein IspZ [Brevundimonas sp. A19_0]MBO9501907.1 septation protein IspZ [Brevundimonas sp. A19_0]
MSTRKQPPAWVRQAVDFGALAAFGGAFLFYRIKGLPGDEALVQATWFLVGGAAIAVIVGAVVERRLALMPLIVGGFALVFGVLTLVTQDDIWVKLKVTVLNLTLAVALLGGLRLGKNPLKLLLGSVIPINDRAWRILTLRYGLFFAVVGLTNELVRSEALVGWAMSQIGREGIDPADVWVSFRGVLWIASSVFGICNLPLILRNLEPGSDESVPPIEGPNAAP